MICLARLNLWDWVFESGDFRVLGKAISHCDFDIAQFVNHDSAYYSIVRPVLLDLWFTIRGVRLDLLLNGLSHLMPLFYNVGKSSKTSSSHVMLVKKNWWDLYNIWISFLKCHIFLPLISYLDISFIVSFFPFLFYFRDLEV